MIGLDTNILVRYIVQDDKLQSEMATSFIEQKSSQDPIFFVNHIILCELVWVLRRCYNANKDAITQVIEQILKTSVFQVQSPQAVWTALKLYRNNRADFSDCLIGRINHENECRITVTLGKAAARLNEFSELSTL